MRFSFIAGGLAVLAIAVAALLVTSRDEPEGETIRGLPGQGFPLRGNLADDSGAVDGAVAAWREEAEAPDEDDEAGRDEARPHPSEDSDITVLWVGRADERRDVAILASRDLIAEVSRRKGGEWFVSGARRRTRNERTPLGAGDSVLVPADTRWRFVAAGFGSAHKNAGDGLYWADGSGGDGFILPAAGGRDSIPIYITNVGARLLTPDTFAALEQAFEGGNERAVWLAAAEADRTLREGAESADGPSAPLFELVWTGRVPDQRHAAVVAQGGGYFGRRAAALGFGETPGEEDRTEDRNEGAEGLGVNQRGRRDGRNRNAFAAGVYTTIDGVPYLVLAGSRVESIHALVGDKEVERRGPLALIDARQFVQADGDDPDTVIYGLTEDGNVVAPLREP